MVRRRARMHRSGAARCRRPRKPASGGMVRLLL